MSASMRFPNYKHRFSRKRRMSNNAKQNKTKQTTAALPPQQPFTCAGVTNGAQRIDYQRQRSPFYYCLYPIFRGGTNGGNFDLCRVA